MLVYSGAGNIKTGMSWTVTVNENNFFSTIRILAKFCQWIQGGTSFQKTCVSLLLAIDIGFYYLQRKTSKFVNIALIFFYTWKTPENLHKILGQHVQ